MSEPNASGRCRRGRIPGTLVLDWQSAETRAAAKPLVRKPVTACESCRLAKVKCDAGQPDCARCHNRGIRCRYPFRPPPPAAAAAGPIATPPSSTSQDSPGRALPPLSGGSPDPTVVDSNPLVESDPSSLAGSAATTAAAADMMDWGEAASNHGLEEFNWVFPDATFDTGELDGPSQSQIAHPSPSPEQLNPASDSGRSGPSPLARPVGACLELPSQTPWMTCPCRVNLIAHVPRLESIMQEKPKPRLDEVLSVTEDVIRSCQAIVGCAQCEVGPVDLVSVLTVFQQTASCFNHIANASVDGTIRLGVGAYKVSLTDDMLFKRMLVVNLVRQANALLDSLTSLGQGLFLSPRPQQPRVMNRSPACLNQLNLSYLREVVTSFKSFFLLITDASEDQELK
ncbi:hypothetical protein V2A60_000169 [Cordyceps javanica]